MLHSTFLWLYFINKDHTTFLLTPHLYKMGYSLFICRNCCPYTRKHSTHARSHLPQPKKRRPQTGQGGPHTLHRLRQCVSGMKHQALQPELSRNTPVVSPTVSSTIMEGASCVCASERGPSFLHPTWSTCMRRTRVAFARRRKMAGRVSG